jgi:hypothetical protein
MLAYAVPTPLGTANAIVTTVLQYPIYGRRQGVTHSPTRNSKPEASQEAILLNLLHKAQAAAFALAHGHDIGGYPDRAWRLIGVGERIRDAATQLNELVRVVEPKKHDAVVGLRLRAFLLQTQMRGPGWANSGAASLVPRMTSERRPRKKAEKAGS